MTVWVGLTGGIGSGKSTATKAFADLNVPIIDADALSRSLTASKGVALPAIRKQFGDDLFDSQGELKRDVLRQKVFNYPEQKSKLEALLFPMILEAIAHQKDIFSDTIYGIVDVPLLVENPSFLAEVDRVLVIDVDEQIQVERVIARNGLPVEEVQRIMATQASRSERLRYADDVINNSGTQADLIEAVGRLHQYYTALYTNQCNE